MFITLLKLSLRSLSANKTRAALTTLGIVVGTATVIVVLSVGQGVKALILKQLSTITPETLFVEIQVPIKAASRMEKNNKSGEAIATGVQITTMKIKDVEDAKKLPNIFSASGQAMGQANTTYRNEELTSMLLAVQASIQDIEKNKLIAGRFFTDEEDKSLSRVAVIGYDLKDKLFHGEDPIGKNIKIKQINFKVVGVMEKRGMQMFMNLDESIYLPLETAQKLILGIDYIPYFVIKMQDKNKIASTIYNLETMLRRNHNIKDPAKDDFAIRTQDEAMGIINTITGGISLLLFAIAAISLIVGGVGIMNVMYVTVTERTKEIGLKKAIGAPPAVILKEFIFEAIIITLVGGIIGIFLGIFISWGASAIAKLFSFDWPFVISLPGVAISFSVSALIGLIFGYAPAKRASKLHPIEALRYE
jgi:putative ABC transport system permease protein